MTINHYRNSLDLAENASLWVAENVEKHSAQSIFLPAGNTPKPLYTLWEQEKPLWLNSLSLLQVDDIISGNKKGIFNRFFKKNLPSYYSQLIDPQKSAGRIADLTVLGLGKNGHVAFHEPHVAANFSYGEVLLAPTTQTTLELSDDVKAITYGIGSFLKTKAILLMVAGEGKEIAFQNLIQPSHDMPANQLTVHPNLTIMTLIP